MTMRVLIIKRPGACFPLSFLFISEKSGWEFSFEWWWARDIFASGDRRETMKIRTARFRSFENLFQ